MRIVDRDRGARALEAKLRRLARSRITVGIHEDQASQIHHAGGPTVGEVALDVEFGTEDAPARSFIRAPIDEHAAEIRATILDVGAELIEHPESDADFAVVGEYVAELMRERVPVDTGRLHDAIEARTEVIGE